MQWSPWQRHVGGWWGSEGAKTRQKKGRPSKNNWLSSTRLPQTCAVAFYFVVYVTENLYFHFSLVQKSPESPRKS